jgi:hypothetical protein
MLSGFAGISLGSGRTHRARGSFTPRRTCWSCWSGKSAILYHRFSLVLPRANFDYASGGNSGLIQRNPPVELFSTCTVLFGLILMCTLGSRGRLTLPTIVNSPRDMAAVVISISARAFPVHMIRQVVVTTTMARISFANMAIASCSLGGSWLAQPALNSKIGFPCSCFTPSPALELISALSDQLTRLMRSSLCSYHTNPHTFPFKARDRSPRGEGAQPLTRSRPHRSGLVSSMI